MPRQKPPPSGTGLCSPRMEVWVSTTRITPSTCSMLVWRHSSNNSRINRITSMKTGLPYGSPVFMLVILFMRELLLECRQTSIEQVDGVIRVVDTQTSILGEHSPVPEGGGFCLGIGACDYPTFCIKQAIGLQSRFKPVSYTHLRAHETDSYL